MFLLVLLATKVREPRNGLSVYSNGSKWLLLKVLDFKLTLLHPMQKTCIQLTMHAVSISICLHRLQIDKDPLLHWLHLVTSHCVCLCVRADGGQIE